MPKPQTQKTYILPPTFDHPPSNPGTPGGITLGALLSDPWSPHRPLAVLPLPSHPPTKQTTQLNLSITRTASHSASLSLSAQLLELAGMKACSEFSSSSTKTYSAAKVTTRFFEGDPDEEAVRDLILGNPRAGRVVFGRSHRMGSGGKVYMITAIKVAEEGFTVSTELAVNNGGSLGSDLPVGAIAGGLPVGVSVGAEIGGSRERSEGEAYTVEGAVVIAYRLVVIRKCGWRGRELELDEFRSGDRERMLGDDDGSDDGMEGDDGVEVMDAAVEDLGCDDDEDDEMNPGQVVLESDEGQVVVLVTVGDPVR